MINTFKGLISKFSPRKNGRTAAKFKRIDEYRNMELMVTGELPSWLQGRLIRNCTVPLYDQKDDAHHFDGLSMLHSFQIKDGGVSYSSKYLRSKGFGRAVTSDPQFYPREVDVDKTKNIEDAGVNIFKYNENYVALTETPLPVRFDINNLETLGNFHFDDDLPKKDVFESAHPHYSHDTKELYNFLVEYGHTTQYVIYKMTPSSSERKVVARIPVDKPGYIHSFSMTNNYLILVEYPFVVSPLRLLFARPTSFETYIRLFKWLPRQGTRFIVVEKNTGRFFEIKTESFFSFHHANAYENGNEIILDLIANNLAKLGNVFPQKIVEDTIQGLQRFTINIQENTLRRKNVVDESFEFPKIDDSINGKPYRYLYMVTFNTKNASLIKYDWDNNATSSWSKPNARVIEPVFAPSPNRTLEDEGVLITIVSDNETNNSYLLFVDARSMTELARASLPSLFPTSFHGQFFNISEVQGRGTTLK